MRVERVIYFVEAVRAGSMRAAAERLHVTQSVLGEQITALEEELDLLLVLRSRRGVVPTPAGEHLMARATQLIDAQHEFLAAANGLSAEVAGSVRVGAGPALALSLVTPVVERIHQLHPGIRIQTIESSSAELVQRVSRGHLDFAISTTPEGIEGMRVRHDVLAQLDVAAYVMADHPLAAHPSAPWDALTGWPIVTMALHTPVGQRLAKRVPDAQVVAEVSSTHHVTYLVEQGLGVGIVTAQFGGGPFESPDGRRILLTEPERIGMGITQRLDTPLSRAATVVRDALAQEAAALVDAR